MIHLFQTRGPNHRYNHTKQEHKKWLAIAHYGIGLRTRPTLIGVKHFNCAPNVTSLIHHNTGMRLWERSEGILTSSSAVNTNREKS